MLSFSSADDAVEVIGPFGTLNNTDTAFTIPANKAQDLLNVDLSPGGKSIKKRDGYASAFSLAITSSPVKYIYNFYEAGGSDVSLFFNDTRLASSIGGGSTSVLFSTGPLNATYHCADSAGFAYCNSTSRTAMIKTNGTTATTMPLTSTGTMVAVTPERLVQAGFSEASNRVDFSKANDFTTFTVGGNPTDPIQFTITSPGAKITHLLYAHGRIYVFKDSSFVYILPGPSQGDWVVRTVSPNIGTLFNTSIVRDDVIYFQGQDGHFYAYDGTNLTKLSRDIQATIALTQGRSSNSWSQTTASDFGAGGFTSIDSTTVAGQLSILINPEYNTRATLTVASNYLNKCSGQYYMAMSFTSTNTYLLNAVAPRLGTHGVPGNYTLAIKSDSSSTPGTTLTSGVVYSTAVTTALPSHDDYRVNVPTISIISGMRYWIQMIPLGTCDPPNSSLIWGSDSSATSEYRAYDSTIDSLATLLYKLYGSTYPASGSFVSAVKNAASLTSWDSFQASRADNGGTHTFSIRAATGVFTVNSSTPTYSTITSGAIPTVSTGSYFQIRDVFATTISTASPILYDFTQNWFEGAASDKTHAAYHENALWWSVASGAGATTNNKIIKLDMINQGYLLYDIPVNGMLVRNQSLYFGSPTAGTIFKFGDTTDDNGSAINAYWKSKDFFGVSPFLDKDFKRLSVSFLAVANSSMTVTYTVNGSSSTAYSIPMTRGSSSFGNSNRNLPLGTVGTTFNVKFGNNAINQPFEIFGAQMDYNTKSWVPQ